MLLESSVRIVCLAVLVLLPMRLARVKSAAAWHAAYTVLLVAMLVMPVATAWLPSLAVPILDATPPLVTEPAPMIEFVPIPAEPPLAPTTQAVPPPAPIPPPAVPPFKFRLIYLYVAVTLVLLLRVGLAWLRTRSLFRTSAPAKFGHRGARTFADTPALVSDRITVPVTVGIFRPRVILPSIWTRWDEETLAAALTHEQAHARRRDPLILMLAGINKAVFWFHPLAWWIEHRIAVLAEEAADEACLSTFGDRRRYAAILVDMARAVSTNRGRLAVAMARSPRVSRRIERILAWNGKRPWSRRNFAVLVVSAVSLALITATCQFIARDSGGDTTIAGQVLDSSTNKPIADARVTLKPTRLPFADGSWDAIETETAADGSFAFHVAGPATYQLTAAHDDYINPDPPWESDAPSFETDEATQPARTLLRLDPGYVVRGRVVGADASEPLPDMVVVALPPDAEMRLGRDTSVPVKETISGPDGRYEIRGLADGEYRIQARREPNPALEVAAPGESFRLVSLSTQTYALASVAEARVEVPPDPTVISEVNLNVPPLAPAAIRGDVLAETTAASRSVRLSLTHRGGSSFSSEAEITVGEQYRFTGLAPGPYHLNAIATSDDPSERMRASAEVTLGQRTLIQDLVLVPATRIHGRVFVDGGEVGDDWAVGLHVRREQAVVTFSWSPVSFDAGDGSFTMEGVFPGRYGVVFRNTRGFDLIRVRFDGRTTDGNQIVVPSDTAEHELEVFLEPNE